MRFLTKKIFLILMLLLVKNVMAQDITAIDFDGNVIGKVIPDGTTVNFDNEIIGQITADSFVVNSKGVMIGGAVPQGVAIGNDHKYLGQVAPNGEVLSASGQRVGKVLPSGLVVNASYDVIGAVLAPGLVYDDEGEPVGRLTGNGMYINFTGAEQGFVSATGYAYKKIGDEFVLDGKLIDSKMVVSLDGTFIGSVAPGGQVTDFDSKIIGVLHASGYVYDELGKIIGRTVTTAYAFDDFGKYIGLISYNGEIVQKNKVIGRLRADGRVVDDEGAPIGYKVEINAVVTDLNGKFMGCMAPDGKVVKNGKVLAYLGPKGYAYDEKGALIGQIAQTGPIFDAYGKLKAEAAYNGQVMALYGTKIGVMKGKFAYNGIGVVLGTVAEPSLVLDSKANVLGLTGISSDFKANAMTYKISPFGYVLNTDNQVVGETMPIAEIYDEEGSALGFAGLNGEVFGVPVEKKLKLGASGLVVDASNSVAGSLVKVMGAIFYDNKTKAELSAGNLLFEKSDKIKGKVVPEGKIIAAISKDSENMMPVAGDAFAFAPALNVQGNLIGYADPNGKVFDEDGNLAGSVSENGTISDIKNIYAGHLMNAGVIVNDKCESVGVVDLKGEARNNRDVVIGKLLLNGQVVSETGEIVGHLVQKGSVADLQGKVIGTVNALGQMVNFEKIKEGCLNTQAGFYDKDNVLAGYFIEPKPVMSFENKIIGRVNLNNKFINANSSEKGKVLFGGVVADDDEKNIGLVFKYKFAFDKNGVFMGRVSDEGIVLSDKNEKLAEVRYDGTVVADNKPLGFALYDLYIYDADGKTLGYLTKGNMVKDFSGKTLGYADRGFLVDKNNMLIGRGLRDYFVRDKDQKVIGELNLNGALLDLKGNVLGRVTGASGEIRNDEGVLVGKANMWQFYLPSKRGNVAWSGLPEGKQQGIKVEPVNVPESNMDISGYTQKVVGVVISPDGKYLGDLLDSGMVIDPATGQVIGYERDGLVYDANDDLIGSVDKNAEQQKSQEQNIKPKTEQNMFLPPDAYGISDTPSNLGPGGGFGPNERYDPVRARILAEIQAARQQGIRVGKLSSGIKASSFDGKQNNWDNASYVMSSWRVDMSEMILADKPIPAVLARTIMDSNGASDVPVTAIVERNVYAEDGRNIVIPAGSRVMGQVANGTLNGGSTGSAVRIGITWTRLIRPDGSAFDFNAAKTGDAQGKGGALGYLDEQLLKRYTLPVVTSLMTSGLAYITASGQTDTSSDGNTVQDARAEASQQARDNFLNNMNAIFEDIMQRKTEIASVTYVPAGTRLIIYPKVDLWIRTIDREQEQEAAQRLERPTVFIDDKNPTGRAGEGPERSSSYSTTTSDGTNTKVVYDGNNENIQPTSAPLIDDDAAQRKPKPKTLPPVLVGSTPPPPSKNASGTEKSTNTQAQLF